MKKSPSLLTVLFLSLGIFLSSCEKDDPVPEIDQEVITELTLSFTELNDADEPIPGAGFEVSANDVEGISLGSSPSIEVIDSFEAGKKYQLNIFLYNHIAGEDVTEEVAEHGEEHLFYFLGTSLVGENAFLSYTYGDTDEHGQPIGLKGKITVGEVSAGTTGSFRVVLRHGLDKNFLGASTPNFENMQSAGGESDLDITFEVVL